MPTPNDTPMPRECPVDPDFLPDGGERWPDVAPNPRKLPDFYPRWRPPTVPIPQPPVPFGSVVYC